MSEESFELIGAEQFGVKRRTRGGGQWDLPRFREHAARFDQFIQRNGQFGPQHQGLNALGGGRISVLVQVFIQEVGGPRVVARPVEAHRLVQDVGQRVVRMVRTVRGCVGGTEGG